jgi:hypothetical protein
MRPFIALCVATLTLAMAPRLDAQQRDTTAVDTVGPRPERKPPISPRRAFLYSLAFPGYGQSLLNRNRTGTVLLAFETAALVMRHEMAQDLAEARRIATDSLPVSFADAEGNPVVVYRATPFPASLIRTRKSHVEDWTAVLIANHLFAAADAYVAALLWDLPSEVAVRATPHEASVALTFTW